MVDLRDKVKESQSLLKKIELAIPGFRGYRKREDLRIADSLLRTQLADNIKNVGRYLEGCREVLVRNMEIELLEDAGRLVNLLNAIEGKVRHAEQGYTGISADYRIEENELNKLYEWDLGLVDHIDNLKTSASIFRAAVDSGNRENIRKEMNNINGKIRQFDELFEKRRNAIAGLGG